MIMLLGGTRVVVLHKPPTWIAAPCLCVGHVGQYVPPAVISNNPRPEKYLTIGNVTHCKN